MVAGMIQSKNCRLPAIAGKASSKIKRESQVKKFTRWLQNKNVNANIYFLPFIERLINVLIQNTVYLIFDGSVVARNSACLMASLVYKNRSIPIAWINVEGRKGHFCEEFHIHLLEQVQSMLPEDANVVVIGDGEFDGVNFLQAIIDAGWNFAVRTAKNAVLQKDEHKITLPARLISGCCQYYTGAEFTKDRFGPVTVVATRYKKDKNLTYIISSSTCPHQIQCWYKKRGTIETLFSDQKSRGFMLDKSHLNDIARIGKLMIATSLAYIWLVLLGEYALKVGLNNEFHRTERCDLSLLQLGFRCVEYLLCNNIPIPIPTKQLVLQGNL